MQRQDIVTEARDQLGEVRGTPDFGNPFAWNKLVTKAANDLCRSFDLFYTSAAADVANGQAQYCSPRIHKVKCVSVFTADGKRHTINSAVIPAMDDWSSSWRDETAAAQPTTWIPQGLNAFVLYPVPNYSYANGIVIEGFGVPESVAGAVGSWAADTADCPLPDYTHMGVACRAALLRIARHPTPENMTRRPLIMEEYLRERKLIELHVRTHSVAQREPAYIGMGAGPASGGFDPLDLGG